MSYRADKLVIDGHTHTYTHTHTQATTIPEGQNWPRVKTATKYNNFYSRNYFGNVVCKLAAILRLGINVLNTRQDPTLYGHCNTSMMTYAYGFVFIFTISFPFASAALEQSYKCPTALQWRHDGRYSVSNHQPHDCLLNRLFRRRSKKTSKLCVTGLCVGNSPGTGEFPAQMASNAVNISIWWRHHGVR